MSSDFGNIVAEEYKLKRPLYLSYLGGLLKLKHGFPAIDLSRKINELPGYTVVYPEGMKEKAAVATTDDKDEVLEMLRKPKTTVSSADVRFLNSLQKNLLIAFCRKSKTDDSMYIQKNPPFHFFESKKNDEYIEIKKEYLLDCGLPFDLSKLPQEVSVKLKANISNWSQNEKVNLEIFQIVSTRRPAIRTTLLEQVINAIPQNKRSTVTLSLDIIDCLIKQ